jgi:RNA polymerase sigma factor (sigma-70 family)
MCSQSQPASPDYPPLTPADLSRLVREDGARLRNFIRRRVGNAADVDDLVQDTCLEALRCLHQYQGHSRPETWLFGIAMNLVRGHYKRARIQPIFEEEEMGLDAQLDFSEDPIDTLARYQDIERMHLLVDALPEAQSNVLKLVFDERLTYEQAADRLKIPVGTVRSRIARVRALLKSDKLPRSDVHP